MSSGSDKSLISVIEDVYRFLESLPDGSLSEVYANEKAALIEKINDLQYEFPSLNLESEYDEAASLPAHKIISRSESAASSVRDYPTTPGGSASGSIGQPEPIEDVSASSLEDQKVRSGLLKFKGKNTKKKVSMIKGDPQKWCVIHETTFYVFDSFKAKKQSTAFSIRDGMAKSVEGGKAFTFEITCPNQPQPYVFIASDEQDVREWIKAIDEVSSVDHQAKAVEKKPPRVDKPPLPSSRRPQQLPEIPQQLPEIPHQEAPEIEEEDLYDEADAYLREPLVANPPDLPPRPRPDLPKPDVPRPDLPSAPRPDLPTRAGTSPSSTGSFKTTTLDPKDYDNLFYALYDCTADAANELSFNRGEIIHVVTKEYNPQNWWVGYLNGKVGLVPKMYLTHAYKLIT